MSYLPRIVIGIDMEEDGDIALEQALTLAALGEGAELHLVHVLDTSDRNTQSLSLALDGAMRALRRRMRQVTWPRGVAFDIKLHVRFGSPAATLMQVAVDYDAHMIVVGTHGRRGLPRAMWGSVAGDLTRDARLPVLVARRKDFEGLAPTPTPAIGTEGDDLHHDQIVSEAIRIGPRTSHIAGLL